MASTKDKTKIYNINYNYENTWDVAKSYVSFRIENTNTAIVNSIRRTIINNVQTYGFTQDNITIIQNDSPLHNGLILQRISMIPVNILKTKEFNIDEYEFIINEQNNTKNKMSITTEHFQVLHIATNKYLSRREVETIFPPDPISKEYIEITHLKPSYFKNVNFKTMGAIDNGSDTNITGNLMSFYVKCKLIKGAGCNNALFCPATITGYIYTPEEEDVINIERNKYIDAQKKQCIENKLTPKTDDKYIKQFNTSLIKTIYKKNKQGEPYSYDVFVESKGYFPPLVIYHMGCESLKSIITRFMQNVNDGNDNFIVVSPSPNKIHGYNITVKEENDTLGNIFAYTASKLFCNYGDKNRGLHYIGYSRPHMLIEEILIEIQPIKEMKYNDVITAFIIPTCNEIVGHITLIQSQLENTGELQQEFNNFSKNMF